MTSLQRAPKPVLRLGALLAAPPVLGTMAVLPSAAPAAAATVSGPPAASLPGSAPALAPVPGLVSIGVALNQPIVGTAASGSGFLMAARDGGVFSLAGAGFYGSMGGQRLNQPIVGVAATPSGRGYWLVASDGGIFSFGDAPFLGSMGGRRLASPVVGMAAAPGGRGYWLAGADGGVFSFGTAPFLGSAAGASAFPVTGMAAGGNGYYLAARDGGVFAFGAPFQGAPVGAGKGTVVGIATASGTYRLVTDAGTLLSPGDAGAVRASSAVSLATGVVDGINADRASHGLASVAVDGNLNSLASDWARQCAARNSLVHRDLAAVLALPGWSAYSTLGETIYTGDAATTTAGDVMAGWQSSPTHQAVITDGRFNVVGVGIYVGGGRVWAVADFGRR